MPHLRADLASLLEIVESTGQLKTSLDFGAALLLNPIDMTRYDDVVGRLIDHMKKLHQAVKTIEDNSSDGNPRSERWEAVDAEVAASRDVLRRIRKDNVSVAEALRSLSGAAERTEDALTELGRLLSPYTR